MSSEATTHNEAVLGKAAISTAFTEGHHRSLSRNAIRALARNKAAVAGLFIIILVLILAIIAPVIAPYDPARQDLTSTYAKPSREHLLGTDALGRDILTRILYGARVSMSVALITSTLVVLIGLPVGMLAGFYGGKLDFFDDARR